MSSEMLELHLSGMFECNIRVSCTQGTFSPYSAEPLIRLRRLKRGDFSPQVPNFANHCTVLLIAYLISLIYLSAAPSLRTQEGEGEGEGVKLGRVRHVLSPSARVSVRERERV